MPKPHEIIFALPPQLPEIGAATGSHIRPAQQSAEAKRQQARDALAARARKQKPEISAEERRRRAREAAVTRWGTSNGS